MVGEGSVVDEGGIAGEAVLQLAQAVVAVGVDGKGGRVLLGRLQLLDGQAAVLQRAGKVIQLDAQAVGIFTQGGKAAALLLGERRAIGSLAGEVHGIVARLG